MSSEKAVIKFKAPSFSAQSSLEQTTYNDPLYNTPPVWGLTQIRKISNLTDNQNILSPTQKANANILVGVQGCGKIIDRIPPYLIANFNIYFDDNTSISFITGIRDPYAMASYQYTGTINGLKEYKIADINWVSKGANSKDLDDWTITLNKIVPEFKGFCNMYSTVIYGNAERKYAFPTLNSKPSTPQYLAFNNRDSNDFIFIGDGNDPVGSGSKIVCQNPGKWVITNQYQLDCLYSAEDNIPKKLSGFTAIGGPNKKEIILSDSSATNTVKDKGDKSVLVIVFTLELNKGDYFRVGVLSEDPKTATLNSYPTLGRQNFPNEAKNSVDPTCITLCQKI